MRRSGANGLERERRSRTFLGDDSWLEVIHKVATLCALLFGIWAYFNSVKPVFDKEQELAEQRQRAEQHRRLVEQLTSERSILVQQAERAQSLIAAHREGIVLSHLAGIRAAIENDARAYQGMAPVGFDLRRYSVAWADAQLERLGRPKPGSPEDDEKTALEFFRRFVLETVPPGTDDVHWLSRLLDDFDQERRAPAGAGNP